MDVATFGELLDQGRAHLDACAASTGGSLRVAPVAQAAQAAGRVAMALSRYLEDVAPYGMTETLTSDGGGLLAQAAVDGREALRQAAASLLAGGGGLSGQPADPLTASLTAAATAFAAGGDLLRTHFATGSAGDVPARSDWALALASAPVARALLHETGRCARQLELLTAGLSAAAANSPATRALVALQLAGGCRALAVAGTALATGAGPATGLGPGRALLRAIPVHTVPRRRPPQDLETSDELADGIAVSACRLRVIAPQAARSERHSLYMTVDSWRWTATGAAVICNISQVILTTLGEQHDASRRHVRALRRAAGSAASACAQWREVATAWNDMTTGISGLTAPTVSDTGDLIVRLGRLAFADPAWAPARSHRAPARAPADLAPGRRQAAAVAGAVHQAAEALASVAAADMGAVRSAITAGRIYVPTRTLPSYMDVPYRYGRPTPARAAGLVEVYQAARTATEELLRDIDAVAVTMKAPSRIRAAARAAIRHSREPPTGLALTGGAARPADTGPTDPRAPLPLQPGSVERVVRSIRCTDVAVLMRARAMDTAARKLVADAEQAARQAGRPGQAHRARGTSALPGQPAAQLAGQSFPASSGVPLTATPRHVASSPAAAMAVRTPRIKQS